MRYKVADHEMKLYCKHHQQYLNWYELDCSHGDGEGSPLDPLHWNCPGMDKQVTELNARQDGIDRQALVPLGKDYPVGAKKRVPMEEWPQELLDAWQGLEETKDTAEEACLESWVIEIVPVTKQT